MRTEAGKIAQSTILGIGNGLDGSNDRFGFISLRYGTEFKESFAVGLGGVGVRLRSVGRGIDDATESEDPAACDILYSRLENRSRHADNRIQLRGYGQ